MQLVHDLTFRSLTLVTRLNAPDHSPTGPGSNHVA